MTPEQKRAYNRECNRRWLKRDGNREKARAAKDRCFALKTYTYPERVAFLDARRRCTSPESVQWKNYGGRGIKFLFVSYEQWFAELGPRPTPKHSVDRKNNDGNYEPGNVRWATATEQGQNRRPRKKILEAVAIAA